VSGLEHLGSPPLNKALKEEYIMRVKTKAYFIDK
jgi:hypothetical protein